MIVRSLAAENVCLLLLLLSDERGRFDQVCEEGTFCRRSIDGLNTQQMMDGRNKLPLLV